MRREQSRPYFLMEVKTVAKKIDITDKLSFDESSSLVIHGEEYKVNDDAETAIKVMGLIGSGDDVTPGDIAEIYDLLFPEGDRERIMALKLKFRDYQTIVNEAMSLIIGTDEDSTGEEKTHTTI